MAEYRFFRFEGIPLEEPLRRRYERYRARKGFGWSSLLDLFLLIMVLFCVALALSLVVLVLIAVLIVAPVFLVVQALLRRFAPHNRRRPPRETIIDIEVERP